MAEDSTKLLSISSSEGIRDSIGSVAQARDEEFYEEIEAPKFVDFTSPDHYRPDDRYWFCLRVGCDQKHEEEMNSEAIYKNFVLRVMAARSPNVRLRKALDRNASRTPIKCPLSAPPKPSKPRLSRLAIISSIHQKMVDDKKGVVRCLLKPRPTPMTKTKPVAAKYLTTPRNKKCGSNENSFGSVQNPKPANAEVEKGRTVTKALVFHSPKKAIKVKTSVELCTPISKLCEGMNKLEISSQRKRALGYSGKPSKDLIKHSSTKQLRSRKVQRKREEPHPPPTCTNQEAKSGSITVKSQIKGKLLQQQTPKKLLGNDHTDSLKNNENRDIQQKLAEKENQDIQPQLAEKVAEECRLQESTKEESSGSSTVTPSTKISESACPDEPKGEGNCLDMEVSNNSRTQATDRQGNDSNDWNRSSNSETCGESMNHLNTSNSSEEERIEHEYIDGDDKENAAACEHEIVDGDEKENATASDENRMHNKNLKQNGRQIFGNHEKYDHFKKKDKSLKDGLTYPAQAVKFKKPKPTHPKPFRLRTDERGILKEACLERRTDTLAPHGESANLNKLAGKLQRKQGNDTRKEGMIADLKTPKRQEKSKAAPSVTPEINKHQEQKLMYSPLQSSAIQRLEKFRKMKSPIRRQHTASPQGVAPTKKEMTSFLIPGKKLDVIHEISPELRSTRKPTWNAPPADDASRSSSCGKQRVTVATEPNFHSTHVPRTCTKKLK